MFEFKRAHFEFPVSYLSGTLSTFHSRTRSTSSDKVKMTAIDGWRVAEHCLMVKHISKAKGAGVVAQHPIEQGIYVCQYEGKFTDGLSLGDTSVKRASKPPDLDLFSPGSSANFCMMFWFKNRWCAVDAENAKESVGRMINHSGQRSKINVKNMVVDVKDGDPQIWFKATRDISVGEELLYDYKERDKATLEANPWLCST